MMRLRYAWRQLRRTPTFTIAAIVSLAFGLGANAAIFTLANAVLFRPLAVRHPEQLVRVAASEQGGRPGALLAPMVQSIRDAHIFDGLCGFLAPSNTVAVHGRVSTMATHTMTGDCFATLGVGAVIGRTLTPEDDRAGAPHVAVLSYQFWQREYGGSATALDDQVDIEGTKYSIVGVAQPGFGGLLVGYPAKIFYPLGNFEGGLAGSFPPPMMMPMDVIGRAALRSRAETSALLHGGWQSWLDSSVPSRLGPAQRDRYLHRELHVADAATGVDYSLRPRFEQPLLILVAIAAIVFLATCINVANLQLVRAAGRARERAVRAALGASRGDVVTDSLTESALLLAGGSVLGALTAYGIDRALIATFTASSQNFAIDLAPDRTMLLFAGGLAVFAFALCGIFPAARAARTSAATLNASSSRVIGHGGRLREMSVGLQVALTMVLVSAGVVFVEVVRDLQRAPLGIDGDVVLAAQLTPVPGGYAAGFAPDSYYRALLERANGLPGVDSAAFANAIPLSTFFLSMRVAETGQSAEIDADQSFVTRGYFKTMGIGFVSGATFDQASGAPRQVIVSQSTARSLFGREDVVGKVIRVGPSPQTQALSIAGVVRDAIITNPQRANTRVVYLNQEQFGANVREWPALLLRQRAPGAVSPADVTRIVRDEHHEYVSYMRSVDEQRDIAMSQEHLLAAVSSTMAFVGLALVIVGVFGVLSYTVAQRRIEIGIRVALGASRSRVTWLVMHRALLWIAAGAAIGVPAAAAAERVVTSTMPGRNIDVTTALMVAMAMTAVCTISAVMVPVTRATAVDPLEAMRAE